MPHIKFPPQERITFLLRQDLADRLPSENPDRRKFLNQAVEHELSGLPAAASIMGKTGGARSSERKTAAARENAKKPRPRNRAEGKS
ncbi:MAG: hypothetical protein LBH43_18095 [Treponema sp.]|jgi:hypothetical protein|nr:hypothetical protein [Treponema sp.]